METSVFQLELKDGRIYRIFCANATQKRKLIQSYHNIKDKATSFKAITNGIHTLSQFEQHLKTF